VASAAATYLSVQGAKIVGIIDKEGGLISREGFSLKEVKQMFISKKGNQLRVPDMLSFEEVNEKIWNINAHIFIPERPPNL
jgi:glutamate dehydrogenase/leucine dehydrogenase